MDQEVTGGIHLLAPLFRNSKLENVKLMVTPDTVSSLLSQFQEDLTDQFGFLQRGSSLGQLRQRFIHL